MLYKKGEARRGGARREGKEKRTGGCIGLEWASERSEVVRTRREMLQRCW